jgi:aryl-alcohol dehydrogenase-like predicted oxidoreductase
MGARRKDIVLATKFGMAMNAAGTEKGADRRYIIGAVEASLRRLKTDWIDLYQLHQPDPLTPIEETLRALDDLIRQGKVRYIGCSNLPGWQVVEAEWTARNLGSHRFISCQDEYSLVVRDIERELVPAMNAYGLGLLPYFPLASGLLTGKYRHNEAAPAGARLTLVKRLADRYMTESNWQIVERLRAFSAERGHSLLELAFSWLAQRAPVASVIAGATSPAQLEENARAAGWSLTPAEMAEIDRITKGG